MFQQMLRGSFAVLRHPTVSTFEEHERNQLGYATLYIALGALINGALSALAYIVQRPYAEQQIRDLQHAEQNVPSRLWDVMRGQSFGSAVISSLIVTFVGFFVYVGLVYLLGRLFNGTGGFSELAYDTALFSVPLIVLAAFVQIISIGPFAIVAGFVWFATSIYQLYLTFISIQAGLNVPRDKALLVMLLLLVIGITCVCLLALAFLAIVMYVGLV